MGVKGQPAPHPYAPVHTVLLHAVCSLHIKYVQLWANTHTDSPHHHHHHHPPTQHHMHMLTEYARRDLQRIGHCHVVHRPPDVAGRQGARNLPPRFPLQRRLENMCTREQGRLITMMTGSTSTQQKPYKHNRHRPAGLTRCGVRGKSMIAATVPATVAALPARKTANSRPVSDTMRLVQNSKCEHSMHA